MPKTETYGWVSTHQITAQCSDCTHVVAEGRMCACDKGVAGFPLEAHCTQFEVAE